jgi:serine/threonine protein kinase
VSVVYDYMNAGSLKETIQYVGGLKEEVVRTFSKNLLEGVHYMHTKQ